MKLDGRLALVTGAGTGIGRALAFRLAAAGARLILVGRTEATLRETATVLGSAVETHVLSADITSAPSRRAICTLIQQLGGRLDLLVHNAGIQHAGPIEHVDDPALDAMVRTNLLAPISLTRDLLTALEAARPSRIVLVGSILGDIAIPLFSAYAASKAGLRALADALRRELAPLGVGITYAAPRATRTAMTAATAHLSPDFAMTLDPPERVADWIVRAVERDARSAYPLGSERIFVLLQSLVPTVIDRALGRRHHAPATSRPPSTARSSS